MVEGAGELKLDMGGVYEEGWLVLGTAGARRYNALHTERGNEKVEEKGGNEREEWRWHT